ncbi:MAG: hypothetical protein WBV74_15295 [Pseudonocardiaceae bacterium]
MRREWEPEDLINHQGHVNLYGKFDLDMSTRLDLAALTPIAVTAPREPMVATVL